MTDENTDRDGMITLRDGDEVTGVTIQPPTVIERSEREESIEWYGCKACLSLFGTGHLGKRALEQHNERAHTRVRPE